MDIIFLIIKSLTKPEKRHFRMVSNIQGGSKKYLHLFDIIENLDKYDEKKLIKKLETLNFFPKHYTYDDICSHFRATKSYLKQQILRSLRMLEERSNEAKTRIEQSLKEAKIYLDKGIYNGFEKELRKAKRIAAEFELVDSLYEINKIYIAKLQHTPSKNAIEESNRLHVECENYIEILKLQNTYSKIFHHLYIAYRDGYRFSKQETFFIDLEEIMDGPEFDLSIAQQNFYTHQLYHIILGFYELLNNRLPDALNHFRDSLDVWKPRRTFIKEYPMMYQSWISNYLNLCSVIGKFDEEYQEWFTELKNIPARNKSQVIALLQNTLQLECLYLLNEGELYKANQLIEDIQNTLDKYDDEIPPSRQIVLKYNLMVLYFIQEEYKKAMNLAFEIGNTSDNKHRQDLQAKAKAFYLIFLFELGFYKKLAQMDESIKTQLTRNKQHNEFNKMVQRHLRNIAFSPSKASQLGKLHEFRAELFGLKSQVGMENIGGLGIQEVEYWLESKISKLPIQKVIENRRRLMLE